MFSQEIIQIAIINKTKQNKTSCNALQICIFIYLSTNIFVFKLKNFTIKGTT